MVAMQSQLYDMAKWAIGLRLPGSSHTVVEDAFNSGKILRTHMLRPTWHFVSPNDIRWLIDLTAPHVQRLNKGYHNRHNLDNTELEASVKLIEEQLRSKPIMTKEELSNGIGETSSQRMMWILMHAELEGVVCSGPRTGKKQTYTLIDTAVPSKQEFTRDEELGMLAERYFRSRGPATVKDMAYWSGLTIKDSRKGADTLGKDFVRDGDHIFHETTEDHGTATFLMPDYDEYMMGYKNRDAIADAGDPLWNAWIRSHWIVADGKIAGSWEIPKMKNKRPAISMFDEKRNASKEIDDAADRYLMFWK